jgi:eukaryotic-like serine/threonine-protein kinase
VQPTTAMRQKALLGKQVAGRFTIKRFLGEGGMATVFVAEQEGEPREVALKIMNQELTHDRTFVRRFQREAKASARVKHPSSVQIIDYGVADELSYIAMELLLGDDLYVLLEREGSLSQARAVRILIDVCDALMVAHELGIVHRDLKPENIMVMADPTHPHGERVKVLDFGIAKLLSAESLAEEQSDGRDGRLDPPSAMTRAGTFIGTPAYMSPEQCALLAVDTRADIYTCGVLLFQLITGKLPFEGQTPLHTATLHVHIPPPAPSSIAPRIDPRLEAVILKALAKKPADRHQTALHLGASLRKILPELSEDRVGLQRGDAGGAGSSRRPTAVTIDAAKATAPPHNAHRGGGLDAAAQGPGGQADPGMGDDDMPPESIDNLRTMIRTSAFDIAVPMGAFGQPKAAPTFGPPPVAPTFGAPPPDAGARPFNRTERSISSDVISQARGHAPGPVAIVAPAPHHAQPQPQRHAAAHGPPAYAPPAPAAPYVAPYVAPAPFAPAAHAAPIAPRAAPASSLQGSRGLLIGFAVGVTLVGVMVVAYALLLR